ncbi:MAG: phosphotransferase [Anaerolineae bacterium]|nr:phosphotransferase [Anaerolineae bacterium]
MIPKMKSNAVVEALTHMDVKQLETIVSQSLAEPVIVTDWQVTLLGGLDSSPMAGGVYKMAGTAVSHTNHIHKWQVVIKVLRSPEGVAMPDGTCVTREMAEDQHHFGYWQREALAAQSSLFDNLPAGMRVPQFLGITRISTSECWLWQECLSTDHEWTWDDYREAAYRLGKWQATTHAPCDQPWLSQSWCAKWVHGPLTNIFGMVEGMDGYNHPLLTAYFAPEEMATLRQLWANRQPYLAKLAQLPQTLCHLDAHRGNLSWQGDELALLDWAFVGEGAVGEELAAFVGATLLLDYVPLDNAEKLERAAFDGYLAGLRTAGWSGDETFIWDAYQCAMPLRYAPLALASMLRTVLQPEFATDWEYKTGKPLADILAHRAGLVRFYMSRLPDCKQFVEG